MIHTNYEQEKHTFRLQEILVSRGKVCLVLDSGDQYGVVLRDESLYSDKVTRLLLTKPKEVKVARMRLEAVEYTQFDCFILTAEAEFVPVLQIFSDDKEHSAVVALSTARGRVLKFPAEKVAIAAAAEYCETLFGHINWDEVKVGS